MTPRDRANSFLRYLGSEKTIPTSNPPSGCHEHRGAMYTAASRGGTIASRMLIAMSYAPFATINASFDHNTARTPPIRSILRGLKQYPSRVILLIL